MNSSRRFLLGLLGSVLGFGGFSCAPLYGVPLYGAPPIDTAEYKLSGTVVDSDSKAPIPGVSLSLGWSQTVTSDKDGVWSIDTRAPLRGDYALNARDIDGAANGSYLELEVPVAPTQVLPGSGNDMGVYEQTNIQVSMVPPPTVYEYKLSGKLVDGMSLAPIPGISVSTLGHSAISGEDGTWSLDFEAAPADACIILFQDTDGTAHGAYQDTQLSETLRPITKAGTPAIFLVDCGLMGMMVKP